MMTLFNACLYIDNEIVQCFKFTVNSEFNKNNPVAVSN